MEGTEWDLTGSTDQMSSGIVNVKDKVTDVKSEGSKDIKLGIDKNS